MPLAATLHTAVGAAAFAKFFIQTIDWSFAVVNGAYVRHYAEQSCQTCSIFADGIDKDRSAGYEYVGGRFYGLGVSDLRPRTSFETTAVVTFNSLSFEKLSRTGKFLYGEPAHTNERNQLNLKWTSEWRVASVVVIA